MQLLHETDWLASRPVFYNERTGYSGHNINDVIDLTSVEIDAAGFHDFLDYGYSVFGHTPVRGVRFLRHSSRLWKDEKGCLSVELLDDPVEAWLGRCSSEDDVWDLLQSKVRKWESSVTGDIIIPTSGGYDSRLLNMLIGDKSRIRSFTFGLTENPESSFEVVRARLLAAQLHTQWECIPLGLFHRLFDEWDTLFGVSTHSHGMYQMEFYSQVAARVKVGSPLLSGIIGDAWAGSVNIPEIERPADIRMLGYTHGMHADSSRSKFSGSGNGEEYYERKRDKLRDPLMRVVEAMRFKIILLSYLMRVPTELGFIPWSPFLDIDVAMTMLTMPSSRRSGRLWQREYFQKNHVDFENMALPETFENHLNRHAARKVHLIPLDARTLGEVVCTSYVHWINRNVARISCQWDRLWMAARRRPRRIGWCLERCGLNDQWLQSYCAYLTLKPIESLLRKRILDRVA